MKSEYISPTLLVLIYCILVLVGIYNLLFENFGLIRALSVATNTVILMVLLVVAGRRALSAGILFCWVKMGLGAALVLVGVWEVITLSPLVGLYLIAVGSIAGIGLAYWTLMVLRVIAQQSRTPEA